MKLIVPPNPPTRWRPAAAGCPAGSPRLNLSQGLQYRDGTVWAGGTRLVMAISLLMFARFVNSQFSMPDRYPPTIDQLRQVKNDLDGMRARAEEISQLMQAGYGDADRKSIRAEEVNAAIQRLQWELERNSATEGSEMLALTIKKGGKITSSGRIAVAADGKSRTVTTSGTDSKGKKISSTAVYDKQ
jgi:hypothetical protein